MSEKIYVQSMTVEMKLPNGEIVVGKFTGLSICSPSDWKDMAKNSLGEALHGDNPIMFSAPRPIDELISDDSDQHDIIDSLRRELQNDHHDKLKE